MPGERSAWAQEVDRAQAELARRLALAEALLVALDASLTRHRGETEAHVRRLDQALQRVTGDLDVHVSGSWEHRQRAERGEG